MTSRPEGLGVSSELLSHKSAANGILSGSISTIWIAEIHKLDIGRGACNLLFRANYNNFRWKRIYEACVKCIVSSNFKEIMDKYPSITLSQYIPMERNYGSTASKQCELLRI
jgi:hypothetical protein